MNSEEVNRIGARTGVLVLKNSNEVPRNSINGRPRIS